MIATVKVYYNTGLTPTNSLDSSLKLDSLGFNSQAFPNIAILQDRGNVSIRIDTTWDLIKNADYCKINNTCFWITSIDMLNENVAQLQLQEDFITTVGTTNITIIAGQCERRHVNDDTLLANTIPEPFTPTSELVLDIGTNIIGYESESGDNTVILSTVDFNKLDYTAKTYTDSISNLNVTVPLLPLPNDDDTIYTMTLENGSKSTNIGATSAYQPNDEALQQIRSLGIESAIIASYVLPQAYVTATTANGQYKTLTSKYKETVSTLDIEYMPPTQIKNKKVFSGQFQKYIIMSPCSGETKEYKPEDIYYEGGVTNFVIWCTTADPRYNGYPMCKPKKYHNADNLNWLTGIKGVQWQNSPISYNFASGYTLMLTTSLKNLARQFRNNTLQGISNIGNIAMGVTLPSKTVTPTATGFTGLSQLPTVTNNPMTINSQGMSGITGLGSNIANSINSYYDTMQDLRQSFFTTPDLDFAEIPNLQDYIGNYFYEMRYRLSDRDTERFDNFLTQFGYAVDEELTNDVFFGRQHFNYVKANSVNLKTPYSYFETMGVISALTNGVRIWHTAPSFFAMTDNPKV